MEFVETIEEEKDILVKELDRLFSNFSLIETPDLAEILERYLHQHLVSIVRKHSEYLLGLTNKDSSYLCYEDMHLLFSIKIAVDLMNPGKASLLVQPHALDEHHELKEFHIRVNGYGNIDELNFIYPSFLNVKLESLNALLKNSIEIGYNWFKIKIEDLVAKDKISLTKNLYGYIRKIIPSDELRQHLWFATVTDGYGFRLIDYNVAMNLFSEIDKCSRDFGFSTNRLVGEMLSTKLPKHKILMQKAIEENRIMDVNISEARYSQDGDIYAGAMTAFYGADSFTIHPILIDRKANILALYPTNKRNHFEQIISSQNQEIKKICENSTKNIKQALSLFNEKKSNVGKWGEFLGGFTRTFLDLVH